MTIRFRSGKNNTNADVMSRQKSEEVGNSYNWMKVFVNVTTVLVGKNT